VITKIKQKLNILDKKIVKNLTQIAIPIIIGNLLQLAYQMTDLFWIGKLGIDEIAAISTSLPIIFIFISLGMGISIAGLILISQENGKQNQPQINIISGQMITIMSFLGILISILGYYLTPTLINLNSSTQIVTNLAIQYTQISFIGMIFMYLMLCFKDLMSGIQEMILPLKITLFTVLLNLIIDPILINHYNLGIQGAAYATIFTQSLACLIALIIIKNKKTKIQPELKNLKPNNQLIKTIFKMGIPACIEMSAISLAELALIMIISSFPTVIIAAFGIGIQTFNIILYISIGSLIATSVLIGEAIGQNQKTKAKEISKTSLIFTTLINITIAIIVFIIAKQIIGTFTPDPEVIKAGTIFLRIISLTFPFFGIEKTLTGVFQGSGNPQYAMIIVIISLWIIQIPLVYTLSNYTELKELGIWIAMVIAGISAAGLSYYLFKKEKWLNKNLINHN